MPSTRSTHQERRASAGRLRAAAVPSTRARRALTQAVRGAQADGQGQPRQGAGQHVPAHPVGAEEEGEPGGQVGAGEVGLHGPGAQEDAQQGDGQEEGRSPGQEPDGPLPLVERLHVRVAPLRILTQRSTVRRSAAQAASKDNGGGEDGNAQQQGHVAAQAGVTAACPRPG